MSAPRRIMVVDDSSVVRRLLGDVLRSNPGFEVAYLAATGPLAIRRLAQGGVDLVLLDVEMPDMDGIETLKRIRTQCPTLPVVMCSALTERGAVVTLEALENGASDYITKPKTGVGADTFAAELTRKIQGLLPSPQVPKSPFAPKTRSLVAQSPAPAVRKTDAPVEIIAIGSSTGGPAALTTLFRSLPHGLRVPIVITQHMPPMFTRLLAERLSANTGHPVKEGEHGDVLRPGHAYVAPGGRHMVVRKGLTKMMLELNEEPPEQSCRPAVDVMFRSVASAYGSSALGCVLTGMGRDGTEGAKAITTAGGAVVVQSAETCVVPSMPVSVAAAGVADREAPLDQIAEELARRVARVGLRASRTKGVVNL